MVCKQEEQTQKVTESKTNESRQNYHTLNILFPRNMKRHTHNPHTQPLYN